MGGVLLGGIGTGTALVEYSSLTYGGKKQIGAQNLVTEAFDFSFEPEKGKLTVNCGWWNYESRRTPVETDESIPLNTVRYEVTYNKELTQPQLVFDEIPLEEADESPASGQPDDSDQPEAFGQPDDSGQPDAAGQLDASGQADGGSGQPDVPDRMQGYLDVVVNRRPSEFALWMECKDEVLSELKEGRIASYDVAYITEVKVKVHPDMLPYILDDAAHLVG